MRRLWAYMSQAPETPAFAVVLFVWLMTVGCTLAGVIHWR